MALKRMTAATMRPKISKITRSLTMRSQKKAAATLVLKFLIIASITT